MTTADKKPPRQYGTGTIFQRKDGRWVGRYRDGYTATGNYRYRTVTAATEAACKTALNKAMRDQKRDDQAAGTDSKATVKQWCEKWLQLREAQVRPKTWATDRSAVTGWIVPQIGARKLADLTPDDLRKVDRAVKAKGLSQSTVKRTRDVLVLALKAAAVEGYDVPPRLFMVASPALGKSDRQAIPVEDAVSILKVLTDGGDKRARSRWVAALLQGMRQAECLGLTWDRIDLDEGLVDVSRQAQALTSKHGCGGDCKKQRAAACYAREFRIPDSFVAEQIDGAWHWTQPKTKAGARIIPLVPWMVTALKEWREVSPASPHGLVWPGPGGKPMDPRDDLDEFHELQKSAKVAHPTGRFYHVHEARHTTATMLLAIGVDPQIITAIMGHSTILSSRTYMHADPRMLRTALDGVAEQLQLTV